MKKIAFIALTALLSIFLLAVAISHSTIAYADDNFDFEEMLDSHGSIMLLIDPVDGSIRYANQSAINFYGYSREQLESMKIGDINTLDEEAMRQAIRDVAAQNKNFHRFEHKLANGTTRIVEVSAYPYTYGSETLLFSVIRDVTADVHANQRSARQKDMIIIASISFAAILMIMGILLLWSFLKLKNKKQEIENFDQLRKTFINSQSEIVFLKDENLKYIFINKALEEFSGKKESEIIGNDDLEVIGEEFSKLLIESDLEVISKSGTIHLEIIWKNTIYKVTKFPIKMINGSYGVGTFLKDITEEKREKRHQEKSFLRNSILVDLFSRDFDSSEEQMDYVLIELLKLTDSKIGYIFLYDEYSEMFSLLCSSTEKVAEVPQNQRYAKYQLEKTGRWGNVVREKKSIIVNEYLTDEKYKTDSEAFSQMKKYMTVPIVIDKKIIAVVGLANKLEDYDNHDVYQVSALMQGVWNDRERTEIQKNLYLERNKFLQTLLSIGDGVMVVDTEGKIERLNKIAEKLTGWNIQEAKGRHYKEVFVLSHENKELEIKDPIEGVLQTGEIKELSNHAILTTRDGQKVFLEDSAAPIKNENDEMIGVVLVFRDVTERRAQRVKIEYLSFRDSLTGLYNRRFFEEEIRRLDAKKNLPISIIMGDVNGLKLTNDIFGHSSGDLLLMKVAKSIRKACRADDIIARWGGDEFVILLPKTGKEEAEAVISRIQQQFSKEKVKAIQTSISMGCGVKQDAEDHIIRVLEYAEDEMYSKKTLDRNKVKSNIIKTIMNTLHSISPREADHSKSVSEISTLVAKELKLSEVDTRRIKDAAFYHDIGKIAVDEKIINKRQALSPTEKKEMRQHPVVGFRVLNSFDKTLDLAESVLTHHERWDGKGYPRGLKGEEIPVLSRIISVAESYDEMTNYPVYKQPVSKQEAIEEIIKNAGTQFDPDIVKAFVKVMAKHN